MILPSKLALFVGIALRVEVFSNEQDSYGKDSAFVRNDGCFFFPANS